MRMERDLIMTTRNDPYRIQCVRTGGDCSLFWFKVLKTSTRQGTWHPLVSFICCNQWCLIACKCWIG